MSEGTSTSGRLLLVARLVVAAALFVRLGGIGLGWMPSAPVLAASLVLLLSADALVRLYGQGRLHDWRASVYRHRFRLGLAALALFAVLVRLPSIDSGLWHQPVDIDENRLAANIKHFFTTGEIVHTTVEHYPGVVFWMLTAASLVAYLGGLMRGVLHTVQEMPVETFVLAGRVTNAVLAAATVAFTGLLARRLSGAGAGLVAAALLAIVPLSVQTTTSMRNDPGQVLFLVAAVWMSFELYDSRAPRAALIAGALAGVATGIKYTSVFVLIPVLMAAAMRDPLPARARLAWLGVLGFLVALGTTNHFLWADFPTFVRQLGDQVAITGKGHWAATLNPSAVHVDILDRFGPGWPAVMAGAAWGAYGLATGRRDAWLFLVFPLVYSWFTTHRPSQLPRWVYPLVPFVAVAASAALTSAVGAIREWPGWRRVPQAVAVRRLALAAIVFLVLAPPFWSGAEIVSRRLRAPTYRLLEAWLEGHVPQGDVVLIEQGWLAFPGSTLKVRRVPSLEDALKSGSYAASTSDWVVVPDSVFGSPLLKGLRLVKRFSEDRSLGGNMGSDFEVYATPALAPEDRVDIRLDQMQAARYLGPEWKAADRRLPGLALPAGGASVYLPPLGHDASRLEVAVTPAGAPTDRMPIGVRVGGQPVVMTDLPPTEPGVRRLTGSAGFVVGKAIEVRLEPASRDVPIRVLTVRVG